MDTFLATAAAAAVLFAGTNIDDMVVLAVLSASSRSGGRPRRWHIWAGQYAGITAVVIVSLAAARGLTLVPERWLWLLGLLPLGLGVRKLVTAVRAHRSGGQATAAAAGGLPGVIGTTIANGGDNLAAWLVSHHKVTQSIGPWGQWIVPVVYILIGFYIFQKAGVFGRVL
jgi:cadmium resistance protein CadD (predicted permease)